MKALWFGMIILSKLDRRQPSRQAFSNELPEAVHQTYYWSVIHNLLCFRLFAQQYHVCSIATMETPGIKRPKSIEGVHDVSLDDIPSPLIEQPCEAIRAGRLACWNIPNN